MPPTGRRPPRPAPEPSAAVIEQAVRKVLTELGAANLRDRALGYGKPEDGALAGKHNAVWATLRLQGAGQYEVKHKLGSVPILCELKRLRSAVGASPTPHASAVGVRVSEWTDSTCRVDIQLLTAGTLDNCVAEFLVRGA